jgi:hypothetical protein
VGAGEGIALRVDAELNNEPGLPAHLLRERSA